MKTSRRWMAIVVAGALLATVSGSALAATTVTGAVYTDSQNKPAAQVTQELQKAGIKDVKATDWAAGSLAVVVEAGLMRPDANGNLNPNAQVTADEGVAIFAKALGIASRTDDAATAAKKAKDAGLVSATPTANADMSRLDVARLLAKALGIQPKTTLGNHFQDADALNAADAAILNALYEAGVFKGFPDGTFRPNAVLTTAQIAILLDRILSASGK